MTVRLSGADRAIRRKRIADAVAGGADPNEVARDEGLTTMSVERACAEYGVPCEVSRNAHSRQLNYPLIADLLNTRSKLVVLARRHKISVRRVSGVMASLRAVGLDRPGVGR